MLQRIKKYQYRFNTYDVLKIAALLSMVVDHAGYLLIHSQTGIPEFTSRIIGRFAAPVFFFLIGFHIAADFGHIPPLDMRKWCNWFKSPLNWLPLGLILTAAFTLMDLIDVYFFNILLNLFIVRQFLIWSHPQHWTSIAIIATVIFFAFLEYFFNVRVYLEYGMAGIIFAIGGTLIAVGRRRMAGLILVLAIAVLPCVPFSYNELVIVFYAGIFSGLYQKGESQLLPLLENMLLLLIFVQMLTWYILTFFKLRQVSVPEWSRSIFLFCSHYTMEIYFVHFMLFGFVCYVRINLL